MIGVYKAPRVATWVERGKSKVAEINGQRVLEITESNRIVFPNGMATSSYQSFDDALKAATPFLNEG